MRETRQQLGLSLEALADATGIDPTTLSRYETGKRAPSVGRGVLVARALGVSLEFLVGEQHDRDAATPETHQTEIAA